MLRPLHLILTLCPLILASSCSQPSAPEPQTGADVDAGPDGVVMVAEVPADESDEDLAAVVVITRDIAERCNIPEPHFAFDSASVRDHAEPSLDALTACLTNGPLEGEKISLVGHADERGPASYNFALGQRRAARVQKYLVDNGVRTSRITTSSKGELLADEAGGYDDDRRVEISVKN